jgi:hypothetical protein
VTVPTAKAVAVLPLKCPLCDGESVLDDVWPTPAVLCPMCKGTGERPSDEELQERRDRDYE